jgi:hypothetical protein
MNRSQTTGGHYELEANIDRFFRNHRDSTLSLRQPQKSTSHPDASHDRRLGAIANPRTTKPARSNGASGPSQDRPGTLGPIHTPRNKANKSGI